MEPEFVYCIDISLVTENSKHTANQYLCPICLNLAIDPVICDESECVFCKSCINDWSKRKNDCPNCKKKLVLNNKTKNLMSIFSTIELNCLNLENGCAEIIHYDDYENHLKSCNYKISKCFNQNCNFKSLLKDMNTHLQECEFRKEECIYCNNLILFNELLVHLQSCDQLQQICQVCGLNLKDNLLKYHNKGECYEILKNLYIKNKEILVENDNFQENLGLIEKKLYYDQKLKKLSSEKDNLSNMIEKIKMENEEIKKEIENLSILNINEPNKMKNNSNNKKCVHKFEITSSSYHDPMKKNICNNCNTDKSLRFICSKCESMLCFKCNWNKDDKCPKGHKYIRAIREVDFNCDVCQKYFKENEYSSFDKICDIDICDKCWNGEKKSIMDRLWSSFFK